MGDRDALLRAVRAAPDDDLPRLVVADWLDEAGDGHRAAYIRAQVELARLVADERYDSDEYVAASRQLGDMLPATLRDWAEQDGLPVLPSPRLLTRDQAADRDRVRDVKAELTYGFRRGFVEFVSCPLAFWLEHGPTVAARCPLGRVELVGVSPYRVVSRREWVWVPDEAGEPGRAPITLPVELFDELPGRQARVAVYPSRKAAVDAMSLACLGYARVEATDE